MTNKQELELKEVRKSIDDIDNKILELIEERTKNVKKVGDIKHNQNSPIYRPQRELEILKRLEAKSSYLNLEQIGAIFYEIFSFSRNYEKTQSISFLGPKYSYTHEASMQKFSSSSTYIPSSSIKDVFINIEQNISSYGVVPIENSSNGIVSETLNFLDKYNMNIVSEISLDIKHILVGNNSDLKSIKKIYSKDIAFSQCATFLDKYNLRSEEKNFSVHSTSEAARLASEDSDTLAICSKYAAKFYQLPIIYENIQDLKNNRTRFLVIEKNQNNYKETCVASIEYKTSMLIRTENKSGSLYLLLQSFYKEDINLIKIKSHIYEGITLFFIEALIHRDDEKFLNILKKHKNSIKILGTYIKDIDEI